LGQRAARIPANAYRLGRFANAVPIRSKIIMVVALIFSSLFLLIAIVSIRRQIISLKRLRSDEVIPSDDRSYLRNQAYRRLLTSALIIGLSGMLSGWFLSGMDQRAVEIGEKKAVNEKGEKPPVSQEDRDFARLSLSYWIGLLILLFIIVSLAVVDIVATRRYAWQQLRRIQTENRAILERDLAMYRQQKANDRMRHL
jgi:hypothetical protein